MVKKLIVALSIVVGTSAQAQVPHMRVVPSQGETMASDPDGAFGVIALANYAIECMSRQDPLRRQTMDKMAALTLNFRQEEIRAAKKEVGAMIYDQSGRKRTEQFCRTVEAGLSKGETAR
jgi:hypothetical protein